MRLLGGGERGYLEGNAPLHLVAARVNIVQSTLYQAKMTTSDC